LALLADRFSESLNNFLRALTVLDRQLLKDYLLKEWTTLGDFPDAIWVRRASSQEACLKKMAGRFENLHRRISPVEKGPRLILMTRTEYVRLTATRELQDMLFQEGANYARDPDKIPEQPGILRAGVDGAGMPTCVYCPDPSYSDASRAAKFQGVVVLSVVVTLEGKADSIYVVKGAPFGLATKAIAAVRTWKFKPAQKDGMPVPVRVPVELTLRLF
jgi:TonB family protein